MTPEQKARTRIDQQLYEAGWLVQDYARMHISAGRGVAVGEFPLQNATNPHFRRGMKGGR